MFVSVYYVFTLFTFVFVAGKTIMNVKGSVDVKVDPPMDIHVS